MKDNYGKVKKSFNIQAEKMAGYHMSKAVYTDYLLKKINPIGGEIALDVAAGTCICGRALAPYVKSVVCVDLTQAMLDEGKKEAEKSKLDNISFLISTAEKLPFDDETFDIAVTRLSMHHFTEPEKVFNEMERVLKKGGKLVIWDMEAVQNDLREINDNIERMRDNSHTKILSRKEFEELFCEKFGLVCEELTYVPVELERWMNLTDTPERIKSEIVKKLTGELNGGDKTGFCPYIKNGKIYFDHRWLLLIGEKKQ